MSKKKTPNPHKERKNLLTIKLSLIVLVIFFCSEMLTVGVTIVVSAVLTDGESSIIQLISALVASLLLGALLSIIVTNIFLKPLNLLIAATKNIRNGDFTSTELVSWKEKYTLSELNQLIRAFNDMNEELNANEIFHKDFISNFSHEFKTPLVSIKGFAQQLYDGNLPPEQQKEFSRIILEEADFLSKLSTDTLLLTKLESQYIITERTEYSLDEQLRSCMLSLEPAWSSKNIEIDMDLSEITIYRNESILNHVWSNLIDNAIKFTPENGKITVTSKESKNGIVVSVSDTGCGIPEDKIPFIFEKFYQCDGSRSTKGNGLGLSLVKRIVDLCGGDISVTSVIGKGTAFTVTIPYSVKE